MSELLSEAMREVFKVIGLNEENSEKAVTLIEAHIDDRVNTEFETLKNAIDEYLAYATDEIQESVGELAKLMDDMVTAKTAEERRAVLLRISAAAKAAACSGADGDWAGGAPDDAENNRHSIGGHANEGAENYVQKQQALHIFNSVAETLNADQVEEFKSMVEDLEFDGDVQALHETLTNAKQTLFGHTGPMASYMRAIDRHVRK